MLRDATQFQPGKLRSECFWPGLGAALPGIGDIGRSLLLQLSTGSVICAQIMSDIHLGA